MATASSPSPSRFFSLFPLPFFFSPFLFFFLFFLYELFFFLFLPPFFSFIFACLSFPLFLFLPSLCISLLLFEALTVWVKRRKFPPPFLKQMCGFPFSFFFFLFLFIFMTSYPTWLNMSHGIMPPHVAQCEPFLFIPSVTLLRCHVASPVLAMCHPTPQASKNVKSRPPRNPMKFDMVAKFHETISTEKSVSSSEI